MARIAVRRRRLYHRRVNVAGKWICRRRRRLEWIARSRLRRAIAHAHARIDSLRLLRVVAVISTRVLIVPPVVHVLLAQRRLPLQKTIVVVPIKNNFF